MNNNKPLLDKNPWVYVISLVERSLPMEWFFDELYNQNENILIVFLNPVQPPIMDALSKKGLQVQWIKYVGKKSIPFVFFKLFNLFRELKPSVLHAHLFDASLVSLPAAALAGIKKRIHTRHHSSHHHYFFPHAVKYDNFINYWSSSIFAISDNVKNILVEDEKVPAQKVKVVHHGFDFGMFQNVSSDRVKVVKGKYTYSEKGPVIGVVSRFTYWKGIQFIISAFEKVLMKYPNAVLILANAKGDYINEINELLSALPYDSYRQILFEADTPALFSSFDLFVHVPIDDHSEAFGQVYIEALMSKVPSVFTLSGIANEFIVDNRNALVVGYKDFDGIYNAIVKLIEDNRLADRLASQGYDGVLELFDVKTMVSNTIAYYGQ